MRCPGQDTQYWKPGDIFDVDCPGCGSKIEFFKDEATRKCRKCGEKVLNPKMDLGCAKHCRRAADCLGRGMTAAGTERAGDNEDKTKDHRDR